MDFYSLLFSFVLPAGIVCVPLIDRSIHYFGLVGSFPMPNLCSVDLAICAARRATRRALAVMCAHHVRGGPVRLTPLTIHLRTPRSRCP